MTPQEARDAAAVMLAFAEGKKIEYFHPVLKEWQPAVSPLWDWTACQYRVAAEPWQGKIWVHPDGRVVGENNADNRQAWSMNGWRLITAKEAQDD